MHSDARRAAEWDCTQLIYRFFWYLDDGRYEDLAGLFTETGVWNRLGKDLVGPAAILDAMKERDTWLTAHVVTNVQVSIIDADRTESNQYVTLYRHEGRNPADGPAEVVLPLGILRHRDQLARVGEAWKFQRKTSKAVMVDRARVTHYDKR